jgi:hypothetical protein
MHTLALFLFENDMDPEAVKHMVGFLLAFIPIIILVGLAIVIVPFWFICKKAGFSPWLSLLYLVPLGNLVLYYVLAFSEWKVVPAPQMGWASQPQYPPYPPQPPFPPTPPQA